MKRPDFKSLASEYYQPLYRFALSLAKNEHDASDLTQQTFALWARKGHQLKDVTKVKSWLFTTLYREFLGQKRKEQRYTHDGTEGIELLPDKSSSNYLNNIDSETAMSVFSQVDDHYRAPLSLFYLKELSYKEIAATLDLPIGTVMSRISRGKKQFRDKLTSFLNDRDQQAFPQLQTGENNDQD
jgi:RNA polymerase sigma-70 factor (ECF subfamily)